MGVVANIVVVVVVEVVHRFLTGELARDIVLLVEEEVLVVVEDDVVGANVGAGEETGSERTMTVVR